MSFSRLARTLGPLRGSHEDVGVFSSDGWGPGALITIGALLGAGSLLLVRCAGTKGRFSLLPGGVALGGGAVM